MIDKYKTVNCIGMDLPIIAELGDGWYLAAHPNGACIARQSFLSVLEPSKGPNEDDDVPQDVRRKSIAEFERFAWPRLKAEFYPDD